MSGVNNESIYRVRAAASDHWVVYRETFEDPVASFPDKAAALAYALNLARHRPNAYSPLERIRTVPR